MELVSFARLQKFFLKNSIPKKRLSFKALQDYRGDYFNRTELLRELHVVSENGRVYRGFKAIRRIMFRLSFFKPIALLCYFPGIPFFGERVYRAFAKNRGKIWRIFQKLRFQLQTCFEKMKKVAV
nr:DCC1-like thiol-disulfide oxidoreductase family protein [Listeria floridensis]